MKKPKEYWIDELGEVFHDINQVDPNKCEHVIEKQAYDKIVQCLQNAQAVIHSEYCLSDRHKDDCNDITEILKELGIESAKN